MFNEDEDWNDEQDDQVLTKAVPQNPQKASSSPNVKKPKVVGKKSLLRTLQRLGKVQELEWKNESQQQDSDSETEKVPVTSQEEEVKEKKKRIYRRKRGKKVETTEEQQDDGDKDQTDKDQTDKDQTDKVQTDKVQTVKDQTVKDQTVEEDKPVTKKRKKDKKNGESKENTTSVVETEQKETIQPAKVDVNKPENTDGLNRKQWRNKMKNKKKCKNKYSEKKPEEEVNKADKIKTDSHSNGNNNNQDKNSLHTPPPALKKRKELKPQKRKKTKEDTDVTTETPTLTGEKEKKTKTVTESPAPEPVVEMVTDVQTPAKKLKPELSKEQIMKREKLRKMLHSPETQTNLEQCPVEQTDKMAASEGEEGTLDRSASLRSRMQQRLESARFRYINELLYSTSSGEAKRMFNQDPEAFGIYHRGYTAQVQKWPANPVDAIIADIQKKPPSLVVADFGCGDCKIARSVKNKVHSFDLASICELVTVCDMANVPLKDGSVDIAVFCLSLMGTNLADFLAEANRVLKMGGVLKIAEVASRFENVRSFITGLANLGFKVESKGTENTHFHSFECVKTEEAPENVKKYGLELRPCVYKKR